MIADIEVFRSALKITAPSMELIGTDAQVPGDLRDVRAWQAGQADSLTLELLAVTLSVLHDTKSAVEYANAEKIWMVVCFCLSRKLRSDASQERIFIGFYPVSTDCWVKSLKA